MLYMLVFISCVCVQLQLYMLLIQSFEPYELPEFERTKYEPLEHERREKAEKVEEPEEATKGKYEWEKKVKVESPPNERDIPIPKVEVTCC